MILLIRTGRTRFCLIIPSCGDHLFLLQNTFLVENASYSSMFDGFGDWHYIGLGTVLFGSVFHGANGLIVVPIAETKRS